MEYLSIGSLKINREKAEFINKQNYLMRKARWFTVLWYNGIEWERGRVMIEWWNGIPVFERFFWIVAFPSSIIFVIQTIMTLLGVENGHDFEVHNLDMSQDFHEHSILGNENSSGILDVKFKLFTIRSITVFFTVFSWAGIVAERHGKEHLTSLLIAMSLGFIMMFVVSFIYYFVQKLTEEGNMDINNAIGKEGEVYLTIPKQGEGSGKIQVVVQGVLRTMDAVTYGEKLTTGEKVIVIKVVDNQLLLVEKIN